MGWGSAVDLFDEIMDAIIPYVPINKLEEVAEKIANPLWMGDWDTEMDSKYFDSILLPIMRRRDMLDDDFDEWYEPRN